MPHSVFIPQAHFILFFNAFSPQAINSFCKEIGVTRSEGEVHLHNLDHHIRADLDATSRRLLGVLRPLRLLITNLADSHFDEVEAKVNAGVIVLGL